MRKYLFFLVTLAVCTMPIVSSAQAPAGKALDMYFIDTEGGQSTLFMSPSGQTLLVDTGNAGERDLNRILEVLKLAGVKQGRAKDQVTWDDYAASGVLVAIAAEVSRYTYTGHGVAGFTWLEKVWPGNEAVKVKLVNDLRATWAKSTFADDIRGMAGRI